MYCKLLIAPLRASKPKSTKLKTNNGWKYGPNEKVLISDCTDMGVAKVKMLMQTE
jgi:hypothetical protein